MKATWPCEGGREGREDGEGGKEDGGGREGGEGGGWIYTELALGQGDVTYLEEDDIEGGGED